MQCSEGSWAAGDVGLALQRSPARAQAGKQHSVRSCGSEGMGAAWRLWCSGKQGRCSGLGGGQGRWSGFRCGQQSTREQGGRAALGTIRWKDTRGNAVGQQSMHARGTAERARSRTRTWSRERMQPGAIPAVTEAGHVTTFSALTLRAHAGAALHSRKDPEHERGRTRTGSRDGMQPGAWALERACRTVGIVRKTSPAACRRPLRAPLRRRQNFAAPRRCSPIALVILTDAAQRAE